MAYDWVKSYKHIERHPKTLTLMDATRLGLNEVIGFLHRFWWWALDAAPDGVVSTIRTPGLCGKLFGFKADFGDAVIKSMVEAGWLDERGDGELVIHDHDEYRRHAWLREGDRERQQRRRRKLRDTENVTERDVTRDVTNVTPQEVEVDKETNHPPNPPPLAAGGGGEAGLVLQFPSATGEEKVLSLWQEECRRRKKPFGADVNTRLGAKILAAALERGELAEEELPGLMAAGSGDAVLARQTLKGIANNWAKYRPPPTARPKPAGMVVTWVCDRCGNSEAGHLPLAEMSELSPYPCRARGCQGGTMIPGGKAPPKRREERNEAYV